MSKVLITGSDGSLGGVLRTVFQDAEFDVVGMPMWAAESVQQARRFLDVPATEDLTHVILNHSVNWLSFLGAGADDCLEADAMHDRMVRANLLVPRAILDHLARYITGPLTVLFITSQTHKVAQRTTSMYCALKAAQTMLMKVAARELAPKGWVINALAPGKIVDTRMSKMTDAQVLLQRGWTAEEADRYAKGLIPMGRFTDCDEVAQAALQIITLPPYVNGAVIDMTGGV